MKTQNIMKTKFFYPIFALIIVSFSACKLGGESNYSPRLVLLNPAKLNSDSALNMNYTAEGNIKFDSLHVNDTITLILVGEGYSNSLTKFTITPTEATDIEVVAPHDSVAQYFSPQSDFVNGKILFGENIVLMNYPYQFVAKKVKEKVKINFQLESDAKEVSNIVAIQLEFPIKP